MTLWIPKKKPPPRRYRWVQAGEVEEWVRMMDDGLTSRQVATEAGRSVCTVRQYAQKWRRENREAT